MSEQVIATARVKVTLEVPAASWDPKLPCEQLLKSAGREAVDQVRIMIQDAKDSRDITIVGEPEVVVVTYKLKE